MSKNLSKNKYYVIYTYDDSWEPAMTVERYFDTEIKANRFLEELKKEFGRTLKFYRLEKITVLKEGFNK
jgi:hypothetical protein